MTDFSSDGGEARSFRKEAEEGSQARARGDEDNGVFWQGRETEFGGSHL